MRDGAGGVGVTVGIAAGNAAGGAVTVGIAAGEASGDALAAALIEAVRARHPRIRFVGIAGPRMQAAGCEAWVAQEKLAVRGFSEVLARVPELVRIRRAFGRRLLRERVPLFIGVDAPDFNLGLARRVKRWGVRTIHFVSPSVWAWRAERIGRIARAVDRMLVLFPFEPPLYSEAGVAVTYVGHPMALRAARPETRAAARETLRLPRSAPVFAVLPGSRVGEIEMHATLVLEAMRRIADARPDARFLVPLVSRPSREAFERARYAGQYADLPITVMYGHATAALQAADVGLVASGTATLEAALARCPHVIFYRVARATARMVARRLLLPYVGLPNVLAGRFVVPELLQDDATAGNLAQAALNLYDDALTRNRLEALFTQMAEALIAPTGELAAQAVEEELARVGIAC
jgi:lipid-A-disaccharide synthase